MSNIYDIGDLVDLTGTFTKPDGSNITPPAVVCTVVAPDGITTSTPTVTVTSTPGAATAAAQTIPDRSGTWWYAFDGTGAAQASGEKEFIVRARRVPR